MEEQDLIWLINNIWERENASGKRGIEGPKTGFWNGRYHAYEATNGIDVGPGFDLKFQSDEFKRKAETVGFTKKELDDILRQRIQKELPYIRQRVEKEGGNPNTLTKEIIGGLFDIYHTRQNGLYNEFPKLWKAIAIGDYPAMQRESRTTYKDKRGNKHVDEERWNYRKQMYFQDPNVGKYIKKQDPYKIPALITEKEPQPIYQGIIQNGPVPYKTTINSMYSPQKAYGGIMEKANQFEIGGDKNRKRIITTGGAGYVPNFPSFPPLHLPKSEKDLKLRFYKHFNPYLAYTDNNIDRAVNLTLFGPEYAKKKYEEEEAKTPFPIPYTEGASRPFDDAVWGTYLGIPSGHRKYDSVLEPSHYRPTKGRETVQYYKIPIGKATRDELVREGSNLRNNESKNTDALFGYNMGTSTVSKGVDPHKGQYISYYDKWDINPLRGRYSSNSVSGVAKKLLGSDKVGDVFRGHTNPPEFYDRIYLGDYYGVPDRVPDKGTYYGGWLPEVTVYKGNGGYIQKKHSSYKEWDSLSLGEKSEVMSTAIRGGITDLAGIKKAWNEFAEGGDTKEKEYISTMEKVAEENYDKWGFNSPDEALVHALNDNTYDYQMAVKPNIFRRPNNSYFYQANPESEEVNLTPVNTVFDNPALWTFTDDAGRIYTPRKKPVATQGVITQAPNRNRLSSVIGNYIGELKYDLDNGVPVGGKYTMPAIAASALLPLAGEAAYPLLTNPYVDAIITSGFAGHGLNHAINEGIDSWGDAAMTALEIAPLGRLAKPMWDAGKQGLQYTIKAIDNATRYASPSYDLYRTIGETPVSKGSLQRTLTEDFGIFTGPKRVTFFDTPYRQTLDDSFNLIKESTEAPKQYGMRFSGKHGNVPEVLGEDGKWHGVVKYYKNKKFSDPIDNSIIVGKESKYQPTNYLFHYDTGNYPIHYNIDGSPMLHRLPNRNGDLGPIWWSENSKWGDRSVVEPRLIKAPDYGKYRQSLVGDNIGDSSAILTGDYPLNDAEFLERDNLVGTMRKGIFAQQPTVKATEAPTIEWTDAAITTPIVTHFYHGSPVRFDAFSADFIGSGEGGSKVMRGINLWPEEKIANAPKFANIKSSDAPLHLGVSNTPLGGELNPTVYDVSGRGLKLYTASPREVKSLNQSDLISQGYDGIQTPNQVTVFPESISKLSIDKQSSIEDFVMSHPEVERWNPWTTDSQKMQNIIDRSKMSIGMNGTPVESRTVSPWIKELPIEEGRYYRHVRPDALESYRANGVVSQFNQYGNNPTEFDVPMFSQGKPTPHRESINSLGDIWVISKPGAKLEWESVNQGAAMSPRFGGEFNKAPISEFEFYQYDPARGYFKLNEGLTNAPFSKNPHVDYLYGLSEQQQIEYLTQNGLNDQWLWTLKNKPDHLESALRGAPVPTNEGLVVSALPDYSGGIKTDFDLFRRFTDRGKLKEAMRNVETSSKNIDVTSNILVDSDKRFMMFEPGRFINHDIGAMSVEEVVSTFGPEAEYYKKLYDVSKAHNFEGKYAQIGKDAEYNILNRFAINKADPDVAKGIVEARGIYDIPEYRARFNRWGTLGDTFVDDALARIDDVKLQGRSKSLPIKGQHGVHGGAYTSPDATTIGITNSDSSSWITDMIRHEANHVGHGLKRQPDWMRYHNEKIRPVVKESKTTDTALDKYYDEMDEIVERSKTAVEYANKIRKKGETLDQALTRLADTTEANIYNLAIPADVRQSIARYTKDSILNFWKNFVGSYAAPITIGAGTIYGASQQQKAFGGWLKPLTF